MAGKEPRCICGSCPSFNECGAKAFCFDETGKSKCIKEEKGCLCPSCPVQDKFKFSHTYYCIRGSDKKQGKK
ncbi:MAG TPA: DUF2769 domain-containing protein [Nanoarchaeota archaeon]|nr:DUF2769 domain-containing protein [Nanoarchaeota archaeon]